MKYVSHLFILAQIHKLLHGGHAVSWMECPLYGGSERGSISWGSLSVELKMGPIRRQLILQIYHELSTPRQYINSVLQTLAERRETLTGKFALETFKNERHNGFFEEKLNVRPNSRHNPIIQEQTCRTERHRKSAIPYMSRMLNKDKTRNPK